MKKNTSSIIILGAPRSGTNMLRDLICKHPKLITWDCDEINSIWKYGNYKKTDELEVVDLNTRIKNYIVNQFCELNNSNNSIIVEKTCANTLRPNFINQIFPDCKFLFIYRDGYDCVLSAKKKSAKRFDLKYQMKKLKYSPLISLPFILYEKIFTKNWGPNYNGMNKDLKSLSDLVVVAKQWMKCNFKTLNFLETIDSSRYLKINYETFVSDPKKGLESIFKFLELDESDLKKIDTNHIFRSSVGKSKSNFSISEKSKISIYIDEINKRLLI